MILTSFLTFTSILSTVMCFRPNLRRANGMTIEMALREAEVVVIGSGIAGLCCASILASRGVDVVVCESHYEIGGCAHEFCYTENGQVIPSDKLTPEQNVYRFEAGPSLYSGLSPDISPNPLKHVFQMIGEEPEWIGYDVWGAFLPEAPDGFKSGIGSVAFEEVLEKYGGPTAKSDWNKVVTALRPIAKGVMALPT
eukprot:gene12138-25473_t